MKISKSLSTKTSMGYAAIIAIALITSATCFIILQRNQKIDSEIANTYTPAINLFKDTNSMIMEIKRLLSSWIYTPAKQDKDKLTALLETDINSLAAQLNAQMQSTDNKDIKLKINALIQKLDTIKEGAQKITLTLATDDDYANDEKVDNALTMYEKTVVPAVDEMDQYLKLSVKSIFDKFKEIQAQKEQAFMMLNTAFVAMILLILAAAAFSVFLNKKIIISPINELKSIILAMSKGEIMEVKNATSNDEIGEMTVALQKMLDGARSNTNFAVEIGKGNYNSDFMPLSDKDVMGNALIDMRNNLKTNTEESERRTWITTGLAQIGDVLRRTNISSAELYDEVVRYIVRYTGSNQAGLFVIADENVHVKQQELQLVACYAYERKKFMEKNVLVGEGMLGQCVLEKDKIFLTQVPQHYVSITSGLGMATPNCLLIVPLKINENVHGVLEIASFKVYEPYEIEFIEKIAESIGSVVSTIKINEKTKKLLEESQIQGEQLRAQEEEMRQNMEELQATQEEIHRKEKSYLEEISILKSRLGMSNFKAA
ncbi:MAG: GAF domain-containing protein [Cytophagales bacterium]|nr:GAF domain-containing protein [Cytophagales bacterium]